MSEAGSVPELVVAAFGGLSKMARALGHRHPTKISGWLKSGRIPHWRRAEIVTAAERDGVTLPTAFTNPPADPSGKSSEAA